ncbi:GNAT family N-acetyltransferase [Peptostreptococcus faecalis]|uniref:GNAT family N-acetyltransferase n=1 Tax=Peptostreptococcus faecalis TaxID=2045015 RepID=UPI000C7B05EC|nr:GNAT family N-acetyltransferase [Peptostreptococcus faecalis]
MKIVHNNGEQKGAFIALEGEKEMGEMTYTWVGKSKFIIDHTGVNDEFKGQGVGKALVMSAVEYARKNDLKIMPLCPFAAGLFKQNKELQDLVF